MAKSWMMIMHQTDKEHEEQEEACAISEVQHAERAVCDLQIFSEVVVGAEWELKMSECTRNAVL